MTDEQTRRAVLGTAGLSVASLLAGCGGGSGDPGTGDGGESTVDSYLESTTNYDGIQDETGTDAVTVEVGTLANGGNFGFSPPAIRVDTGTAVRWVWTGEGGQHNVISEDDTFRSDTSTEEGFEFDYTFEESGGCLYYCQPHATLGMKGAVVVE